MRINHLWDSLGIDGKANDEMP